MKEFFAASINVSDAMCPPQEQARARRRGRGGGGGGRGRAPQHPPPRRGACLPSRRSGAPRHRP